MAGNEDILGTAIIELRASFEKLTGDLDKAKAQANKSMAAIDDAKVRVEADTDAALADIRGVGKGLDALEDESVRVTSDTGAALSEVKSLDRALDGIEDETVRVDVDTSGATAGVNNIKGAVGGLAGLGVGAVVKGWSDDFGYFQDQVSGAATATGASMDQLSGIARGFEIIPPGVAAAGINQLTQIQVAFGATGPVALASAQDMLRVAQAASAVVGVPVAEVVDSMSSAFRGEFDSLQRVIPAISAATIETKALEMSGKASTAELTAQEKAMAAQAVIMEQGAGLIGQYAANQDTQAFATKRAADAAGEASIAFGEAMAPAMGLVLDVLVPVSEFFSGLPGPIQAVIGVGGLLVAGLAAIGFIAPAVGAGLATIGIGGGTAAAGLGTTAVGMTAVAPAGVAAGVGFGAAATGLWALLAPMLPFIAVVALVVGAIYLLVTHFDTLKEAAGAVVGWLGEQWEKMKLAAGMAWDWVSDKVGGFVDWLTGIPGRIGEVFTGMWDGVIGGAKGAFNFVAQSWNRTIGAFGFTVPSWVPVMGGRRFDMPDMPQLAEGGSITRSGFAMVGEKGPEVRWLNKGEAISPIGDGGPGGGGRGGAPTLVFEAGAFAGNVMTTRDFAYELRDLLGEM